MKIGFIGLGKLGLPCAVAVATKGHEVMGYDIYSKLMNKEPRPYRETGPDGIEPFNPYLEESNLSFGSIKEVADFAEIIFVAVQTPHEEKYEGVTRIPDERIDFDYSYLEQAVKDLADVVNRDVTVVIISTVLPGTVKKKILPIVNEHMKICYNPFFIAMGTTMRDYLHPEFILFGVHDETAAAKAESFYKTMTDASFYKTSVENAELIKVSYNTFIGMKIVFANTLMEICHKTPGTNVDEVTGALKLASRRLISGSYLDGGMGDGGGCHPRDNIAMSWLAQELDLSCDFFEDLMVAREKQTEWLADLICREKEQYDLPIVILGKAFKEQTNLTVGSPSILLRNILLERQIEPAMYDPHLDELKNNFLKSIFFIGTKHREFHDFDFPPGSIIIDPWRYLEETASQLEGIRYIAVGKGHISIESTSTMKSEGARI
ncbi:MAG: nucleotide sugar dehydrogenase [Lentisphaeraceae bacterium]|nr:nucleotide sugar dehydrogenase [Lentisphaeraceae bacterium]